MKTTTIWPPRHLNRPEIFAVMFLFITSSLLSLQGCKDCENCSPPVVKLGPPPSINFSLVVGGQVETVAENDASITVFRNDQLQVSFHIDIPNGYFDARVNGEVQNAVLGLDGKTADLKYSPWEIRSGIPDTLVVRDLRGYSAYFAIHPVYEVGLNPGDIVPGSWQKTPIGIPQDVTIERLIGTADESILAVADGTIYKSTNNSSIWKIVHNDELGGFSGMVLHPSGAIYATGWTIAASGFSYSLFYKSIDNGNTWSQLKTNLPSNAFGQLVMSKEGTLQLYVYDPANLHSGIWRSQDGEKWSLSSDIFKHQLNSYVVTSLATVNDSTTFALVDGWEVPTLMIHSFDNGKTWNSDILPGQSFKNLLCSSNGLIYIYSYGSDIFVSENLGKSWKEVKSGIPGNQNPINTIAEGSDGKIYVAPKNYGVFTLEGDRWKSVGTDLAPYDVHNCFRVGETIYAGVQPSTLYKLE